MTENELVLTMIQAQAGVVALVGSRIWYGVLPEGNNTMPAITFNKVGARRYKVLDSMLTGTSKIRWQFTAWGATMVSTAVLAETLRAAMVSALGTFGSYKVQSVEPVDGREMDGKDPETGKWFSSQDMYITIEEN